jgi:hypothetical protein
MFVAKGFYSQLGNMNTNKPLVNLKIKIYLHAHLDFKTSNIKHLKINRTIHKADICGTEFHIQEKRKTYSDVMQKLKKTTEQWKTTFVTFFG